VTLAYEVRLYRAARRYLERCDRPTRRRFIKRLEELAESPYEHSKPLRGAKGERSSRLGRWRIIFEPDDEQNVLHVYTIRPRGDVYSRI